MIIFDEKKHAEQMLITGFITPNQEIKDLFILSKYLYYQKHPEDCVGQILNIFLQEYKPEYSENIRNGIARKTAASGKTGILVFNKRIDIYENELNTVESLNDINLERLMFTYIVLSKFFNGLFKISRSELFRLAGIEIHNREKPGLIYELNKSGFTVTTTKKNKTLRGVNIKSSGKIVMSFVVDNSFVFKYLLHKKYYVNCQLCKVPVIRINNKTRWCDNCKIDIRRKQWRDYKNKIRCPQIEK